MEKINIKFDEEQLDDIVNRVTENIMKKAKEDSITEVRHEEPKLKRLLMYLEANETGYTSEVKRIYFGHVFNTFSKECASCYDLSDEFDRKKVDKLKKQGWKEEVVYK